MTNTSRHSCRVTRMLRWPAALLLASLSLLTSTECIVILHQKTATQELYSWASGQDKLATASTQYRCLVEGFSKSRKDKKVFSQYGEDGIINFIFQCLGSGNKKFVEFGVEAGVECETRWLREAFNWTGLMIDGSHHKPSIGLYQERIYAENIVALFQKYKVPQAPDFLVVDIDLNTFWVLHALLAAGYLPRVLSVEYNRSFHPKQAYTTMYMPDESWPGTCYMGASALALERLVKHFNYSLVAMDNEGVNLFFVRNSEIGAAMPNTYSSLTPKYTQAAWAIEHYFCYYTAWQQVPASAPFSSPNLMELLQPVILGHSRDQPASVFGQPSKRIFHEAVLPVALKVQPGCMETDVAATLKVAAGAKMWAGAKGPQLPEEEQPASSFLACPNGSNKEAAHSGGGSSGASGGGGDGSSSSSSSSSSSGGGGGGGDAHSSGQTTAGASHGQHVTHRRMIDHGHHQHRAGSRG